MKKLKKILKNNEKAITLISLVVTIIVLLILAGISISMLSGDNGILRKAGDAKEINGISQEKESISLAYSSVIIDKINRGDNSSVRGTELDVAIKTYDTGASAEDGDNQIIVTFENGHKYTIDINGEISLTEITEVTNITLEETNITIDEGEEYTLIATTNTTEDLIWNWARTSGDTSLTITTSGEGNGTGKIVGIGVGTATVTVSAPNAETKTCIVTIKSPYIDYSYVEYDVAYTDVYSGTTYTKNTGWRLLTSDTTLASNYSGATNAGIAGEEATYQGDIEIISTGIPAILYYYNYSSTSISTKVFDGNIYASGDSNYPYMHNGGTPGNWYGNDTQRTNYLQEYTFPDRISSNQNIYAASGLMYNFRNIGFKTTNDTLNYTTVFTHCGGFKHISVNGMTKTASTSDEIIADSLFRSSIASGTIAGMRTLSLLDVKGSNNSNTNVSTDAMDPSGRIGLYRLCDYTPDLHIKGSYFLASPQAKSSAYLLHLEKSGKINYFTSANDYEGIRPVISITGIKMKREQGSHVWKIVSSLN